MAQFWQVYSYKIVLALFFLGLTFLVNYFVAVFLEKLMARTDGGQKVVYRLFASFAKGVILVVGLVSVLGALGVNISAVIASLGLTGFALGFALKDAVSNSLAGAMILFYRPFHIGEEIEIMGCRGRVIDIDLRYTCLEGIGKNYLIPNSACFTNKLVKYFDEEEAPSEEN